MCTNPFFLCQKKTGFEISGLCGSHPLPWYQMVSDTFRVPCGWFPGLRSVRKTFRADLPVKNMIFRSQIHWFPHGGPGPGWDWIWEGNQWFSAVRGSSAGNRWSNSTETIQKLHFWACKSSLGHPGGSRSQKIPEFLNVHILYKSLAPARWAEDLEIAVK